MVLLTMNFSVIPALADWTEPPANPPLSNRPEPLDVSAASQTKIGGLTIGDGSYNATLLISSDSALTVQGAATFSQVADFTGGLTVGPVASGWAGYFSGPVGITGSASVGATGAGYFVVGGADQAGYRNNGDAYFYGKINVVGDAKAGSLTLGGQTITSWSQASSSLWTDAGTYIYPNNASGVNISDSNAISVCNGVCGMVQLPYTSVVGNFTNAQRLGVAVFGSAGDTDSVGIYGYANGANSYAGYFSGNVNTTGMTTLGSATLNLTASQNLLYGNIDTASAGNLLLLQTESVDKLKVDKNGNVNVGGNIYLSSTNPYGGASYYNAQKEQGVSNASVAGAGWYRVAHIDGEIGRGQNTVTIYTVGGDYAPRSTTIRWFHDWGAAAGINVISELGNSLWSQARVTDDAVSNSYLEVYFTQNIAQLYLSLQYDGGFARGALYSGALASGSGNIRATAPLGLLTVGTDKFYINTAGNVGIGTTNPSQKLEVSNTNIAVASIRSLSTLNNSGDNLAALYFGDAYNAGQSRILVERDAQGGSGDNPTNISFWTTPDGSGTSAERLRIDNQGQVGIGTTNPTSKLSFGGSSEITIATSDGSDNGVLTIAGGGSSGVARGGYIYLYGNEAATYGGAVRIIAGSSGSPGDIELYAGGATRMLVDNLGNVGIGTANPGYKLAVNGPLQLQGTSAPTGANGVIYYDSASNKFRCYENGSWKDCISVGSLSGSGTQNYVAKWTSGSALGSSIIYDDGINAGIGTNAPAQKLEVQDNTSGTARFRITDNAQNPELQLQYGNNANDHWSIYVDNSTDNLKLWSGSDVVTVIPGATAGGIKTNNYYSANGANPAIKFDGGNVIIRLGQ